MTAYYCDSSILVKRHIREAGTQWVNELLETQASNIFTAQISIVEVYSALNRRLREGSINANDYHDLIAQAIFFFESEYEVTRLSKQIIDVACAVLERHPLRAFDAIHLATALRVNEQLKEKKEPGPIFLSTDNRLLTAAAAEDFSTFNPATSI
jgi:predicted nucleic acid-binding protein